MTKKEALEVLMKELSKNNELMFQLKLMAIYLQEYEVAANLVHREKGITQLKKWNDEINNKE
jgi:hypothetical protein